MFWSLATVVGKSLTLLAAAGVIGGGFSVYLARRPDFQAQQATLSRYLAGSAVLGLFATLLYFVLQVGAINQRGLAGIMDPVMAGILAQSGPGDTTGLRLLGFISVMPALYLFKRHRDIQNAGSSYFWLFLVFICTATALLTFSFVLTGHVSTLSTLARTTIMVHVVAVFLWTGSLYPLLRLSATEDLSSVQKLMHRFGTSALFIVAILLLTGIFLLTQLLQSFGELLSTEYGLIVLLKLLGVSGLLAFAGMNKLLLVPGLKSHKSTRFLQASIRTEIAAAVFVLAVTAWLTTMVGPAGQ